MLYNKFNESFANAKYSCSIKKFYEENLFQFQLFQILCEKTKFTDDKNLNMLLNVSRKIKNIKNIFKDIKIFDFNTTDKLDVIIARLKDSYNYDFCVLKNFLQFSNLDNSNSNININKNSNNANRLLNLVNIKSFLLQKNKESPVNVKITKQEKGFCCISHKAKERKTLNICHFLKARQAFFSKKKNYISEGTDRDIISKYFDIEKILEENLNKELQKSYENINMVENLFEINKNKNLNKGSFIYHIEKLPMSLFQEYQLFYKSNMHKLINFYSKEVNVLTKVKDKDLLSHKLLPTFSIYKKHSFKNFKMENYGFRAVLANHGPGDLLFIGSSADYSQKIIEVFKEKYMIDFFQNNFQIFPELEFFSENEIPIHAFIIKQGDIANISPGAVYM